METLSLRTPSPKFMPRNLNEIVRLGIRLQENLISELRAFIRIEYLTPLFRLLLKKHLDNCCSDRSSFSASRIRLFRQMCVCTFRLQIRKGNRIQQKIIAISVRFRKLMIQIMAVLHERDLRRQIPEMTEMSVQHYENTETVN